MCSSTSLVKMIKIRYFWTDSNDGAMMVFHFQSHHQSISSHSRIVHNNYHHLEIFLYQNYLCSGKLNWACVTTLGKWYKNPAELHKTRWILKIVWLKWENPSRDSLILINTNGWTIIELWSSCSRALHIFSTLLVCQLFFFFFFFVIRQLPESVTFQSIYQVFIRYLL